MKYLQIFILFCIISIIYSKNIIKIHQKNPSSTLLLENGNDATKDPQTETHDGQEINNDEEINDGHIDIKSKKWKICTFKKGNNPNLKGKSIDIELSDDSGSYKFLEKYRGDGNKYLTKEFIDKYVEFCNKDIKGAYALLPEELFIEMGLNKLDLLVYGSSGSNTLLHTVSGWKKSNKMDGEDNEDIRVHFRLRNYETLFESFKMSWKAPKKKNGNGNGINEFLEEDDAYTATDDYSSFLQYDIKDIEETKQDKEEYYINNNEFKKLYKNEKLHKLKWIKNRKLIPDITNEMALVELQSKTQAKFGFEANFKDSFGRLKAFKIDKLNINIQPIFQRTVRFHSADWSFGIWSGVQFTYGYDWLTQIGFAIDCSGVPQGIGRVKPFQLIGETDGIRSGYKALTFRFTIGLVPVYGSLYLGIELAPQIVVNPGLNVAFSYKTVITESGTRTYYLDSTAKDVLRSVPSNYHKSKKTDLFKFDISSDSEEYAFTIKPMLELRAYASVVLFNTFGIKFMAGLNFITEIKTTAVAPSPVVNAYTLESYIDPNIKIMLVFEPMWLISWQTRLTMDLGHLDKIPMISKHTYCLQNIVPLFPTALCPKVTPKFSQEDLVLPPLDKNWGSYMLAEGFRLLSQQLQGQTILCGRSEDVDFGFSLLTVSFSEALIYSEKSIKKTCGCVVGRSEKLKSKGYLQVEDVKYPCPAKVVESLVVMVKEGDAISKPVEEAVRFLLSMHGYSIKTSSTCTVPKCAPSKKLKEYVIDMRINSGLSKKFAIDMSTWSALFSVPEE